MSPKLASQDDASTDSEVAASQVSNNTAEDASLSKTSFDSIVSNVAPSGKPTSTKDEGAPSAVTCAESKTAEAALADNSSAASTVRTHIAEAVSSDSTAATSIDSNAALPAGLPLNELTKRSAHIGK